MGADRRRPKRYGAGIVGRILASVLVPGVASCSSFGLGAKPASYCGHGDIVAVANGHHTRLGIDCAGLYGGPHRPTVQLRSGQVVKFVHLGSRNVTSTDNAVLGRRRATLVARRPGDAEVLMDGVTCLSDQSTGPDPSTGACDVLRVRVITAP